MSHLSNMLFLFVCVLGLKVIGSTPDYDDDPTDDEVPLCTLKEIQYGASLALLDKSSIECGGFLLSSHWFVTTSSCTYVIDRPSDYIIMGGWSSLQKVLCKKIYRHPQYDPKTHENDIAIVRVLGAFSSDIDYPQLAGKGFSAKCSDVTIVAWAANRQGSRIYNLEELPELFCMEARLLEPATCTANVATSTVPHKYVLCSSAGATEEHPCEHDMGGPLLCNGTVVGISFKSGDCMQAHKQLFTAYVKIEEYFDFLNSVLKQNGDRLREKRQGGVVTYVAERSNGDDGWNNTSCFLVFLGIVISRVSRLGFLSEK